MSAEAPSTMTHEVVGDVLVIEPQMSVLDSTSGDAFRAAVEPHLGEEAKVAFDLCRVTFVDSAGLGTILSCLKQLVAVGGDLKLCAVAPHVLDTLQLARIPQILEIHPTREAAVESYA